MNKHEWANKEVEAYPLELPAHNRSVLRLMKEKEFDENEVSNRDYRPEDEGEQRGEREID